MIGLILNAIALIFVSAFGLVATGFIVYFVAMLAHAGLVEWRLEGIANRKRLDAAIAEQRARLDRERAVESARIDAEVQRVLGERR